MELLALTQTYGSARRQVDAGAAVLAQELASRSARELGHQGLAARNGERSAEKFVQKLTGVSVSDARALAATGALLNAVSQGDADWLAPVAAAVEAGVLSTAGAAAIAEGLGDPSATVSSSDLLDASTSLVSLAVTSTAEHASQSARLMRAQLDLDSVADLEAHRRAKRSLKWFPLPDGMTRLTAVLDPESTAVVVGALDTALSPRRGGPRFVDGAEQRRSAAMLRDARTNEQLAVDVLVAIIELAGRAASTPIDNASECGSAGVFGQKSPAVRVHVHAESLDIGTGLAYFEGQSAVVRVHTAERHICNSGVLPILFDGTQPIDAGRTQRLHSPRQRAAITAFWNGCAWNCDKPPQFTEVHHIEKWNGSNTTLANGISLCRFHHMEVHANGWGIAAMEDGTHWLIPPEKLDPLQTPVQLRAKSPLKRVG